MRISDANPSNNSITASDTTTTAFPLDALPETIRQFTEECAAALPVAPELVAVPALAVMGTAIGNARGIELKPGWRETAILFAAIISPTGTMKSPALAEAVNPLQELDRPTHRTWTADVTVEQLAILIQHNPKGLLSVRDELTAWVKSMNQYKKAGQGSDLQFFLSVWNGSPIRVDRKTGVDGKPTAIEIPRPFLSVVGCLPPDMVQELDEKNGLDDGFLARILFSWPEPVHGGWSDGVISTPVREAYANRINELFALPYEGAPLWLPLAPDAKEHFATWVNQHYVETTAPELSPFLRAAYAKYKGYCARLALIHALGTNPLATTIEDASITAACRLIDYFKAQAGKVAPAVGSVRPEKIERCKAAIRRKLSVCRCTKREIQRSVSGGTELFKKAWEELLQPELKEYSDGTFSLRSSTYRQA